MSGRQLSRFGAKRLTVLIAGVGMLLLMPVSAQAAAENDATQASGSGGTLHLLAGTVRGIVTDVDGTTPREGIPVALRAIDSDAQIAAEATSDAGEFVLAGVPEGTYRLRVGNPGFQATVRLGGGVDDATLLALLPDVLAIAPEGPEVGSAASVALRNAGGVTLTPALMLRGAGRAGGESNDDTAGDQPNSPGGGQGRGAGGGRPPWAPGPPPWAPGPPPWVPGPPPWVSPTAP